MEKLASIEGLLTFWLVVARMGGFTISMPILGSSIIPRQVKVAFVLTLSFLIFSGLNIPQQVPPSHLISYLVYLMSEMGLGFAIGYAVRLIFVGVELSGQIIGFQMGLGFAQFFDVQSVTQTSVISQFKHLLAMMIFISLNAHYFCLKALTDSFTLIPPGGFFLSPPFYSCAPFNSNSDGGYKSSYTPNKYFYDFSSFKNWSGSFDDRSFCALFSVFFGGYLRESLSKDIFVIEISGRLIPLKDRVSKKASYISQK